MFHDAVVFVGSMMPTAIGVAVIYLIVQDRRWK